MRPKKIKLIINIITVIALVILIYISWPQISQGLKEIGGAKWSIIFLMLPLQIINFYAIGKLYQTYLSNQGYKLGAGYCTRLALELNFINHILPSGGISGFSYLGIKLRKKGVPVATTTLAHGMRFAMTFVTFLIIVFIGMFLLSFGSGSSGGGVALFIGLSITFLTLFGVIVAIYIISSEKRIKNFVAFLPKVANGVLSKITHKNTIDIDKIERLFVDLHKDYLYISKDWSRLNKPLFWSFIVNLSEISTAYLAYVALGSLVNPGAVILAYAVASFAGLIAVFPGGIGIYEALMTAVLAAAGVPKALALSATLIYRIFTMIIFVPVGFIFYQISLRKEGVVIDNDKTGASINAN